MSSLLDDHDALGLAALVRTKQISAGELLDDAIARVEALNPSFAFMAQRHYGRASAAIARGLLEGPFTGVPWLFKDFEIDIEGELTEGGSRLLKGRRATSTSELVRRIARAGFVTFGKTTTSELGLTLTTESKLNGATRNPWNPEHSAGGSSGGAAVAVARGVVPTTFCA